MIQEGDTPDGQPFSDLLEKARSGDSGAWDELFARLGDETEESGAAVLAIARKVLPRDHWARDLVESRDVLQSALRVGWINAAKFKGNSEGEFFGWIRTILQNKVHRTARRKENRDRRLVGDLESETPAKGAARDDSPLESLVEEEVRSKVRAALQQLPEDQRIVIELYLKGMTTADIAQLLDLKPDAVRKRESRATARLRELIS